MHNTSVARSSFVQLQFASLLQCVVYNVKKDSETTSMFAMTRSERHAPKVGRDLTREE